MPSSCCPLLDELDAEQRLLEAHRIGAIARLEGAYSPVHHVADEPALEATRATVSADHRLPRLLVALVVAALDICLVEEEVREPRDVVVEIVAVARVGAVGRKPGRGHVATRGVEHRHQQQRPAIGVDLALHAVDVARLGLQPHGQVVRPVAGIGDLIAKVAAALEVEPADAAGSAVLAARALSEGTERYVLTTAGSVQYRLWPDETGFDNLVFAVGAFASLGLPGLSGFIAEFQIFTGSIAAAPVTAVALVGILITAALFLRALQLIFTGETRGRSSGFTDLRPSEVWSVGPLLLFSLLIGVLPRPLLDVIEPAAEVVVELVGR